MIALQPPRLYLVTDRHHCRGRDLLDTVEAALRGGVDALQLREKDLTTRELVVLGRQLRELCLRYGVNLLVNDRIDVAEAIAADGVHLPASSFRVKEAKRLLGPHRLVGVSTHSPEEAHRAAAAGADFVVLGPIYDTPSKRPFGTPLGIDGLARATHSARGPIVAIGGIDTKRAPAVAAAGASGLAVIRAILEADDPEAIAVELRRSFIAEPPSR